MRLLIIGNSSSEVNEAINIAQAKRIRVMMVENIDEGLDFLRSGKGADLILIDVQYNIKLFIESMQAEHIVTPVVAYGINTPPKIAVNAIKDGAKEFLPLPPDEQLIVAILAIISHDQKPLLGQAPSIREVVSIADKIAKTDAHVLITGKSGTGKEVLARYIHEHSLRSGNVFVRVNCAAIPENLLESELFGHEKGAFTGAIAKRIGKFEESSGGTLLLDEVTEMDIKLQAKLLRAIQEQEIDRVGSSGEPVKVNLRIIATSNRNLLDAVAQGLFREDLYFRLNVINLELPKLADRVDDIEELGYFFIKKYSSSNRILEKKLSAEAITKMKLYSWPGNVRELENVIHRAVLLATGAEIMANDIYLRGDGFVAKKIVDVEKELISNTVNYCLGDLTHAANILGISINILQEKLDTYSLK